MKLNLKLKKILIILLNLITNFILEKKIQKLIIRFNYINNFI